MELLTGGQYILSWSKDIEDALRFGQHNAFENIRIIKQQYKNAHLNK